MHRAFQTLVIIAGAAALSACAQNDAPRLNVQSGALDELSIVPSKGLAIPKNLARLPTPTPNGRNRADIDARADALAALGGKRVRGVAGDSKLMAYTLRFGADPEIIPTLAAEDLELRKDSRGRFLERVFEVQVYYKAYRPQTLDPIAELARWQNLNRNVTLPNPPPNP